ncbi:hypothetical protein ACRQ5Q_15325 [Bradyrhizobium sp. PMVTL-01]|uniref:hypothetical protein n=1 Tax=Bradyrhizobium sp. PMVTL-01 TaxID=3434999 RepID=UPI003F6F29F6
MADLLAWSGFYWVGVMVVLAIVTALVVVAGAALVVCVIAFFPKFHCRAPATRMILSTYRTDCYTGEGHHIKSGSDLRISRIIGLSWKVKWVFGLIVFGPDDTPSFSHPEPQGAPVTELFEREGIARCLFYKAMKGHAQWDEMAEPHKDDWRVRADAWILDTTNLIEMSRSLRASPLPRPEGT